MFVVYFKSLSQVQPSTYFALDVISVEEHNIRASVDVVIEGNVEIVAKRTIF